MDDKSYFRQYYIDHREALKKAARGNYAVHKSDPQWIVKRKESQPAIQKKWYKKLKKDPVRLARHRKAGNRRSSEYQKRKRKSDPVWWEEKKKRANRKNRADYANDPLPFLIRNQRRRIREIQARGSHTIAQWKARIAFYGWQCFYCKKSLKSGGLTKEHRIPLSCNGNDFASNLVPACKSCNSKAFYRMRKMA